jgi:hypothetical protein
MNFRFTLPVTIVVFLATVFVSEAPAQMRRMGVSAPFGQARISSRFGPRAGFPRARIGFGGFNRGQFFPGSLLYPYFYPPYFYPPYYPDYDYEEYQQNETQASPPQVITVQPAPAPAPAPAASPVQSLVLENQGGQWVRISNFGQPSALAPSTRPESARAGGPPAKLPPTVLVFRDGHNEEVERYMIQGDVIFIGANYWSTGSWTKKVPIGALDIPATVRLNEERGGKFSLPSGPNEVMLRP